MRIQKIQLENIGAFKNQSIEFREKLSENKAEIHIITGPNGSGKTTLLHAIAASFDSTMIFTDSQNGKTGHTLKNNFHKRFRYLSKDSSVVISINPDTVVRLYGSENQQTIHIVQNNDKIKEYKSQCANQNAVFDFAAFGYSGYRDLNQKTTSKQNGFSQQMPLYNALEFNRQLSMNLQSWIKQTLTKRAIALQGGNLSAANQYALSLSKIEESISEIIEESIEFHIDHHTLEVLVKKDDVLLDFEVLPAGLKSLISWMADLLARLDQLRWVADQNILDRKFLLLLDEVEIHLHPKWQRKILPVIQKLFKNAQIFVSTHSPFIVNSVSDAWVYKLGIENKYSLLEDIVTSQAGRSYAYVLEEIFGVKDEFDIETEREFDEFYRLKNEIIVGKNVNEKLFLNIAEKLAEKSVETGDIVMLELNQLNAITKKSFKI